MGFCITCSKRLRRKVMLGLWVARKTQRPHYGSIAMIPMKAARRIACLFFLVGHVTSLQQAGYTKEMNIIEQLESTRLTAKNGAVYRIKEDSLDITIVTPKLLYSQLIKPYKSQQDIKENIKRCKDEFDVFTCQAIYGSPKQALPARPPKSLLALNIPWAYAQIKYTAIKEQTNNSRTEKTIETRMNCLNPSMPKGYWKHASKSTDIVKFSDFRMNYKNSSNDLRFQLCLLFKRNSDRFMIYRS